jgi:hypothetical protein
MSEIDLLKEIKKIQRELDILKCFDVGKLNPSPWIEYAPVWTAAVVNPVNGAGGSILGRYCQIDKLVTLKITMAFGAGTTYGTGEWRLSLPVPMAYTQPHLGVAWLYDASGAAQMGLVEVTNINYLRIFPYNNLNPVSALVPWTWNASSTDSVALQVSYEAA